MWKVEFRLTRFPHVRIFWPCSSAKIFFAYLRSEGGWVQWYITDSFFVSVVYNKEGPCLSSSFFICVRDFRHGEGGSFVVYLFPYEGESLPIVVVVAVQCKGLQNLLMFLVVLECNEDGGKVLPGEMSVRVTFAASVYMSKTT